MPDILRDLAPTGVLRAGINFGNPVLAQRDPATGQPRGVSVDLARELGRQLDVGVELVSFDAAGKLFDALKSGKCTAQKPGQSRDGPLFVARQMEDKWDIYLYDGHLYFARSWTGELVFRAVIEFAAPQAVLTTVEANRALGVQSEQPFHERSSGSLVRNEPEQVEVRSIGQVRQAGCVLPKKRTEYTRRRSHCFAELE